MGIFIRFSAVILFTILIIGAQSYGSHPYSYNIGLVDTLSYTIEPGEAFVTNLPESLNNQPISEYRPIRVPSDSWTVGRSFFWKPDDTQTGDHTLTFASTVQGESSDTLTLLLNVQPE